MVMTALASHFNASNAMRTETEGHVIYVHEYDLPVVMITVTEMQPAETTQELPVKEFNSTALLRLDDEEWKSSSASPPSEQ
jgi:hypothetical protein